MEMLWWNSWKQLSSISVMVVNYRVQFTSRQGAQWQGEEGTSSSEGWEVGADVAPLKLIEINWFKAADELDYLHWMEAKA